LEKQQEDLYLSVENSHVFSEGVRGKCKGTNPRKIRVVEYQGFQYLIKYTRINLLASALSEYMYLKALQHPLVVRCFGFYSDNDWARIYLEYLGDPWNNLFRTQSLKKEDLSVILSQVDELKALFIKKRILIESKRFGNDKTWYEDFVNIRSDAVYSENDNELGIRRYNGKRIKFELGVTNMLYNPKLKQIKLIDLAEGEVGWDGVFNRFEAFVKGLVV